MSRIGDWLRDQRDGFSGWWQSRRNAGAHGLYQHDRDQRNAMADEAAQHYGEPPRTRLQQIRDDTMRRPTAQQIQANKRDAERAIDELKRQMHGPRNIQGVYHPANRVNTARSSARTPLDDTRTPAQRDRQPGISKWADQPTDQHVTMFGSTRDDRSHEQRNRDHGISSWRDLPPDAPAPQQHGAGRLPTPEDIVADNRKKPTTSPEQGRQAMDEIDKATRKPKPADGGFADWWRDQAPDPEAAERAREEERNRRTGQAPRPATRHAATPEPQQTTFAEPDADPTKGWRLPPQLDDTKPQLPQPYRAGKDKPQSDDTKPRPGDTPEETRYRKTEKHYDRPEDGYDPDMPREAWSAQEEFLRREEEKRFAQWSKRGENESVQAHSDRLDRATQFPGSSDTPEDYNARQEYLRQQATQDASVDHIRRFKDQPNSFTQEPYDPVVGYRSDEGWRQSRAQESWLGSEAKPEDVINQHAKRDSEEGWRGIDAGIRGSGAPAAHEHRTQHGEANKDLEDVTDQTKNRYTPSLKEQILGAAGDRLPAPGVAPGRDVDKDARGADAQEEKQIAQSVKRGENETPQQYSERLNQLNPSSETAKEVVNRAKRDAEKKEKDKLEKERVEEAKAAARAYATEEVKCAPAKMDVIFAAGNRQPAPAAEVTLGRSKSGLRR